MKGRNIGMWWTLSTHPVVRGKFKPSCYKGRKARPGAGPYGPKAKRLPEGAAPGWARLSVKFGIPIEEIPPAFVQEVGREGAAIFLKLAVSRRTGLAQWMHAGQFR